MKQTSFFKNQKKSFGPQDLIGKRKVARPLSARHAIHLVLKSDQIIKFGSFYKYKKIILADLKKFSTKFGIKIFSTTIMHDHLHLTIQIQDRQQYNFFIQAFTGTVARKILDSRSNKTLAPKFWQARPFTRIVQWGRDFQLAQNYLYQNHMEGIGVARYQERNASTIHDRLRIFTDQMQREEELSYEEHMGLGQLSLNFYK